ncbi:hypothetical protein DB32_000410 [Sandaracinus amylolyticus]|uniref:Uncharacterized protein n=2 Tax=Sandaracinus amylolyticus TaxID=927083 RepID=A0A0F6VZ20_9BACT|nr:hypothetical protein DB32_000410 [Sandaracinus amylolyticus]
MKNAAFRLVRGIGIAIHNATNPNKEEWDAYLAMSDATLRAGGDLSRFKQLVFTDGGGPNAAQRKAALDLGRPFGSWSDVKVAVVSSSMGVRGIVTAFNWLGASLRSFSPSQLDDAFAYLGVSPDAALAICDAVDALSASVSGTVRSTAGVSDSKRELARRAAR